MKTEVIMFRDLNGVKVRQNHKTGFFNANDLLEIYRIAAPDSLKTVSHYFQLETSKEFGKEVLKDILQNTTKNDISKTASSNGASHLTELGVLSYSKRGKNGGTWLHPYLFMDFAMWLSPQFKLTCIKWIYDKLIQVRDEVGESFKEVNEALFEQNPQSPPFIYSHEANMINKLVFGSSATGQRNLASEEQLSLLKTLQRADIKLIRAGKNYLERYQELSKFIKLL